MENQQEQDKKYVERDVLGMEKKASSVDFTEGYKTAKKVNWAWIIFAIVAIIALAIIYMMKDEEVEPINTPDNTEMQMEETD